MDNTLERLQQDLLVARKNREQLTVDTLQSALTRITNAEAVAPTIDSHNVGVGSTEAVRKVLTAQEIQQLIQQEIDELAEARASMAAHPDHPYVAELAKKIAILSRYTATL